MKVSTIVRFHDVKHIAYLERAIQSLHSQVNVAVKPIIVLQRFSDEDAQLVSDLMNNNWYFDSHLEPSIINYQDGKDGDVRSSLLNFGIKKHMESQNSLMAFLDYDDIVYSHSYSLLGESLRSSGATIAFARVELFNVIPLHDYDFIYSSDKPYKGKNKFDLLRDNFCPIHSYLINTNKVNTEELHFREEMIRVEDYEFLLRIAGKNPCDFSNIEKNIGAYFIRSDDSNSTPDWTDPNASAEKRKIWEQNKEILKKSRTQIEIKFFASDF